MYFNNDLEWVMSLVLLCGSFFYIGLTFRRRMQYAAFMKNRTNGEYRLVKGTIYSSDSLESTFAPDDRFVYQNIKVNSGRRNTEMFYINIFRILMMPIPNMSMYWSEHESERIWADNIRFTIGDTDYELVKNELRSYYTDVFRMHETIHSNIKYLCNTLYNYAIPYDRADELIVDEHYIRNNSVMTAFGSFSGEENFCPVYLGPEAYVLEKIRTNVYGLRYSRMVLAIMVFFSTIFFIFW